MKAMIADDLRGVWAAIPTPWTADSSLDEAALAENVLRYEAAGVPGVYTTDSDGEFYAIELDEFRRLARAFGRAMESTRMHAAMGVTWSHTGGIIDRIHAALDAGIPNVHVAFPFWMALAKPDVPRFFEDVAQAAPGARWIHYNSRRSHVVLNGRDYARYAREYPEQLIGTKLVSPDFTETAEVLIHAPTLSHFVGDTTLAPGALAGASGVYSYWVNTLPAWTLGCWRLCREHDWEAAMVRQKKLIQWETEYVQPIREQGHFHAIVGKARGELTSFLRGANRTRPPYYPVAPELVDTLKAEFRSFWAGELARETFGGAP
ncbi:MAG: dihydrodipicolinate synthase family protein [Acidobacteria bacterium]|nr:dihydrodipicolinate synthase family protein [Acidobacteriota bacterium]